MSVFADDLGVARPHRDRKGERYMARRDDDGDFYVPPSGRSGRDERARSAPRRRDYYDGSDEEDGLAPSRKARDTRATDDEYDAGRRRNKAGRDSRRDGRDGKGDREARRAAKRDVLDGVPPPPIGSNSPVHRSPLDGDAPPASSRAADDPYDEPSRRSARRDRKEGGGRSRGNEYDDIDVPKSKHKDKAAAYDDDAEPRSKPKRDDLYDDTRRRRRDPYDGEISPRARRQEAPKPRRGGYYDDSDDEYAAPPPRRRHDARDREPRDRDARDREPRDRDAYDRGYRSDGRDPRSRPRDYEERGYRTDGRDSRRDREKERYDAARRKDSHREKDRRGDAYDTDRRRDSKRDRPRNPDRERYADRERDPDRDRYADRDRYGSSKKNGNKQNIGDIIAKSQKHWKSIEPVAKPLLNQVAKAYLEGNRR